MTTTCGMKPAALREQIEMREWYKEVEALYTDAKWLFTVPMVAIEELSATVSFAKESAQ